ncbi:MAG: aldehyde ferredoxin oxidoreductase family protein [Nitrososphaerota archaeon]
MKLGGYAGKILIIDLNKEKILTQSLNMVYAKAYIGGKGLGARYMLDYIDPKVDPLSPDNLFMIFSCPANGTIAPASGKYPVITKSPLTGIWLDSHSGGPIGAELKYAGFDGVIITGRAKEPSYIYIDDQYVDIRKAKNLWGKKISETRKTIKEELGDPLVKVMCIGPSGEKLVRFANVDSEGRQHGRGGAGAVLGSKNIKAVAVRGTGSVEVAYPEEFIKACEEMSRMDIFENPEAQFGIKWGSIALMWPIQEVGALPTRNYTDGRFEHVSSIDANVVLKHSIKRGACFSCPIGCHNYVLIDYGPWAGTLVEGPEYETADLIGANTGTSRFDAIAKANELCDEYGLDTITTGSVVAWSMELFERGLLTLEDTGGLELKFGNAEALVSLIEKIANREGIGDILAEGTRIASQKIGKNSERYAVHVKGLELPAYEPRASPAMGLSYAVADRGGCHLRSWPIGPECLNAYWLGAKPIKLDRWSPENKAIVVVQQEHQYAAKFALGVCDFCCWDNQRLTNILWTVTGFDEYRDVRNFELAGERIINLIRTINVRFGISSKDDKLPPRIHNDPLKTGPAANRVLREEDFEFMKKDYYNIRGWGAEGRPTVEKLKELGMDDVLRYVNWR